MNTSAWHGTAVRYLSGRAEAEAALAALAPTARTIEDAIIANAGMSAWCVGCGRWTWMAQPPTPDGDWANLREGLNCPCGLNGRMRMILTALDALLLQNPMLQRAVVFEKLTALFPHLHRRLPGLIGSEFLGPAYISGQMGTAMKQQVRHESMLDSSYASDSLDLVMHFDVLEHVPDSARALAECHRILRPGGWLLFTCPFYVGLERTLVRARMVDGRIQHDLEPCFHGNPVDGGGALVFTQPGWDLLETIVAAGFPDPGLLLCYDVTRALVSDACPFADGHTWPMVFAARKPVEAEAKRGLRSWLGLRAG